MDNQPPSSKLKKIVLLPNAITAFAVSCGLFVIFKVNMVDPGESTYAGLLTASFILLLAAFADMLDGAVARAMKAESEFGVFFDSIADAITFGVAPSVIVMKSLSVEPGTHLAFLVTTSAIVYSLCGVLRLVRFTVSASHAKADEALSLANKKNFTGLPIPAAAAAVVSANLFLFSPDLAYLGGLDLETGAVVLSSTLLLIGYLMVSRWKFPSLKSLEIRVASFQLVFVVVAFAVAVFYGVLRHFSLVFLSLAWGYVIVGWALSIVRVVAGRRAQSLADFEPDPPEEE